MKQNRKINISNLSKDELLKLDKALSDVRAAIGSTETSKPQEIVKHGRRPAAKVLSYGVRSSSDERSDFKGPVHDYAEIARAVDTESYLARSIQKHREYILKEGWEVVGKTPETVDYVKNRLREFELITGVTTNEWIRQICTDLVTFHTAFLVFKRDVERSTGRRIRLHGKDLDPIAGLFPMDPVSVKVSQNSYGRPIEWRQALNGEERLFDADDVLVFTIDRKTGFVFGTPYCTPVLDDIRALRRLEELVELVTHKHLFPLFHYQVGTEDEPAADIELPDGTTISEVDIVRSQIEEMPTEGGIVTPHRHTIEIIGSQDKVLDLAPYIEHFEARVMAGLRLSGIDVGRGDTANRGTAQVISRNLVDAVRDYQQVMMDCISVKLFDILVLEGSFDLNEETRVYFRFPTADREEERTSQNHGMTLFQSNAITAEELRREYLRKEPLEDQDPDTWHEKYEKPIVKMQLEAKAAAAKAKKSTSKTKKTKNSVTSKNKPTNQYGTLPGKPRYAANDQYELDVLSLWGDLSKILIENHDNIEEKCNLFKDKAIKLSKRYVHNSIDHGLSISKVDCGDKNQSIPVSSIESFITKVVKNDLQKIVNKSIILLRDTTYDNSSILAIFDSVGTELKFMIKNHQLAAYRFGYAHGAKQAGFTKLSVVKDQKVLETINLETANLKDLCIKITEEVRAER
jgi:hypothetical protein